MLTDSARIKLLRELLAQRILVLDGAFGTYISGAEFEPDGFRRRAATKAATRTSSAPGPTKIRRMHRRLSRSGRRHNRDQQLRLDAHRAGRVWPRRPTRANSIASPRELARDEADAFSTADTAALRRGLDGPDDQEHLGHRRRHLRSARRRLPGTGRRPDRGRRRHPAARNRAGHAQLQGWPARHRARAREDRQRGWRSRCRAPSRRWARCWPARISRRFTPRSRIASCSGWASTAPPVRTS